MCNEKIVNICLDVIESNIVPLTQKGVVKGDKVFGAAIVANNNTLINAATNEETNSPLWHGEMSALRDFFALPASKRPEPSECYLISTHEPCSMCASAIAWCGIKQVYFLFSYDDTKESFAIPHDLAILQSLFNTRKTNRDNDYFKSISLVEAIKTLSNNEPYLERIAKIQGVYDELSNVYQSSKSESAIPLK